MHQGYIRRELISILTKRTDFAQPSEQHLSNLTLTIKFPCSKQDQTATEATKIRPAGYYAAKTYRNRNAVTRILIMPETKTIIYGQKEMEKYYLYILKRAQFSTEVQEIIAPVCNQSCKIFFKADVGG